MENEGLDLESIMGKAHELLKRSDAQLNKEQGPRTMRPSIDVTYRYCDLDEDRLEEYNEELERYEEALRQSQDMGINMDIEKPERFNMEEYYKEPEENEMTIFLDDIKRYSPSTSKKKEFKDTTLVVFSDGHALNIVMKYKDFKDLLDGLYRIA